MLLLSKIVGKGHILLACLIFGISSTAAGGEQRGPLDCDFSGIQSPAIPVKIREDGIVGTIFVPADYVLLPGVKDGGTYERLLLSVHKSDFMPFPFRSMLSDVQDQMTILVASPGGVYYKGPRAKPSTTPLANGLARYTAGDDPNRFVGVDGERITDVVRCDGPSAVPPPQCRHFFKADRFFVGISYPRDELDNWKPLRNAVATFITCLAERSRQR